MKGEEEEEGKDGARHFSDATELRTHPSPLACPRCASLVTEQISLRAPLLDYDKDRAFVEEIFFP